MSKDRNMRYFDVLLNWTCYYDTIEIRKNISSYYVVLVYLIVMPGMRMQYFDKQYIVTS